MSNTTASPLVGGDIRRLSRRTLLGTGLAVLGAPWLQTLAADRPRRVVVWSEGTAQQDKVYPDDINHAIADALRKQLPGWTVETAGINDSEQGCSEDSLNRCDVLIWWGHKRHDNVKDEYVDRIERRVKQEGMGFIAVHSSHFAKPNKRLMGTRCSWGAYKTDGCQLKVRVNAPDHPITKGVGDFTLPQIERYSEPYRVPEPEAVPFAGTYVYPDGKEEPTRVGFCWTIGKGRMFYFAPGHETYPNLYRPEVQRLFANAVEWAAGRS
ncbi:MAG: ThuA domain-containing protein [Verrucomicrobiales bacterium]|nr:ThuA domain-containing protein [Verrucomicrobiales bacterium]